MSWNEYTFVDRWQAPGTLEEVTDVLRDAESFARWCPSVYLSVHLVEPGDDSGLGARADIVTRGRLPYTIRWQNRVTAVRHPYGYSFEATGQFEGRGQWILEPRDYGAEATLVWQVRPHIPVVEQTRFLLKPLFGWNHRWAMREGERGLANELQQRRTSAADPR